MFQHIFYAFFTENKLGKFGITVTCSVFRGTGTLVVSDQPATEMGKGLFRYIFNSAEEDDYLAVFATSTTTVDMREIPSMVSKIVSSIDAPISSRSHHNVYDIWDQWTGDMTTGESIGKFLVENIDVPVSSRSSHSPTDIWNVATSALSLVGSIGKYILSMIDQISDIINAGVSIFTPINAESNEIEIVAGDDYSALDNRSLDWTLVGWPDLTSSSISFVAGPLIVAGTVVNPTLVRVELTKAQTITLEKREYEYRVSATTPNSRKITFGRGILLVK